jgi:hypothetical protein
MQLFKQDTKLFRFFEIPELDFGRFLMYILFFQTFFRSGQRRSDFTLRFRLQEVCGQRQDNSVGRCPDSYRDEPGWAHYTLLIRRVLTILVFHRKFDNLLLSFKYN